ncbi:unnamed protein product, partial [Mycena citricolor]
MECDVIRIPNFYETDSCEFDYDIDRRRTSLLSFFVNDAMHSKRRGVVPLLSTGGGVARHLLFCGLCSGFCRARATISTGGGTTNVSIASTSVR